MKYIIVDLEATCWEGPQKGVSEIIEIGAICINEEKKIEKEFCSFVKPILYPLLSAFCTKLTTIRQSDVDAASSFPEVIGKFRNWIGRENEYVLCSWGFYDKYQLQKDCNLHKLETSWLNDHISLKHQHADIRKLMRPIGMNGALAIEGLSLEGTHHRGIDDARNIAKIFLKHFDAWKVEK